MNEDSLNKRASFFFRRKYRPLYGEGHVMLRANVRHDSLPWKQWQGATVIGKHHQKPPVDDKRKIRPYLAYLQRYRMKSTDGDRFESGLGSFQLSFFLPPRVNYQPLYGEEVELIHIEVGTAKTVYCQAEVTMPEISPIVGRPTSGPSRESVPGKKVQRMKTVRSTSFFLFR